MSSNNNSTGSIPTFVSLSTNHGNSVSYDEFQQYILYAYNVMNGIVKGQSGSVYANKNNPSIAQVAARAMQGV